MKLYLAIIFDDDLYELFKEFFPITPILRPQNVLDVSLFKRPDSMHSKCLILIIRFLCDKELFLLIAHNLINNTLNEQ